ncbi:MAG: hypothetical protein HPZ99_06680 [Oscillospiraceae bacterium]|nr:hypothetical protein [Oscillospiraceae bacterium]
MKKPNFLVSAIQKTIFIISLIMLAVGITMIFFVKISEEKYTHDMGSLIGSTLGGIGTLVAVMFTIKDNAERDEKTKINSAMPYLDVFNLNSGNNINNNYNTNYQLLINNNILEQKKDLDTGNAKFRLELIIKNIGLNTATNIIITLQHNGHKYSSTNPFSLEKSICSRRDIIFFEDCFSSDEIEGIYEIILTFKDLYGTNYTQSYSFEIEKNKYDAYSPIDYIAYKSSPSIILK